MYFVRPLAILTLVMSSVHFVLPLGHPYMHLINSTQNVRMIQSQLTAHQPLNIYLKYPPTRPERHVIISS